MNEAVTKRFLLYFRLMLLVWILIANAIIHVTGLEYSWLIFLSNIMMFTLEGDVKDRFVTVELGGLVGLILTVIALLSITAMTKPERPPSVRKVENLSALPVSSLWVYA